MVALGTTACAKGGSLPAKAPAVGPWGGLQLTLLGLVSLLLLDYGLALLGCF